MTTTPHARPLPLPGCTAPQMYWAAVQASAMFADHTYQRALDSPRASALARGWDVRKVGVLDVSDRGADAPVRYAVINGQHRVAAAMIRDPHTSLVARVHLGLTLAQEARLFHEIDTGTRNLTAWDRWKARRVAEDATVLAVTEVVTAAGLRITDTPGDGTIRCPGTLEKIYLTGGKPLLANTLALLIEIWDGCPESVDAHLVRGTATLLRSYDDRIDHSMLGEALREHESGSLTYMIAKTLVLAYNRERGASLPLAQLGKLAPAHRAPRRKSGGKPPSVTVAA
jgi:hypothetical protein